MQVVIKTTSPFYGYNSLRTSVNIPKGFILDLHDKHQPITNTTLLFLRNQDWLLFRDMLR